MTKDLAGNRRTVAMRKRRRLREVELKRLCEFGSRYEWKSVHTALCRQLSGRDPCDPERVSPKDLGSILRLTLKRKMEIEDAATRHGRERGWARRDGQPYRFRLTTIAAFDVTPEEAAAEYKRRANARVAARRKQQRAARALDTPEAEPMQQTSFASYGDAVAASRARSQLQADSLVDAIGDGELTIAKLMAGVRDLPCWCGLEGDRLRRTISDRLDGLKKRGRITDRYEPGPRGSRVRLVRSARR